MFDFVSNLGNDLHALTVHFPLALISLSFLLALAAQSRPQLKETSWHLLVAGTLTAVAAVVTGVVAHFPYEELPVIEHIKPHQLLGLVGTLAMLGLTIARYRTRAKGADVADRGFYRVIAVVGLLWIMLLGGTGGNLVYEHGVNVRGVNPLLEKPSASK